MMALTHLLQTAINDLRAQGFLLFKAILVRMCVRTEVMTNNVTNNDTLA